jgi:hypothetical protein
LCFEQRMVLSGGLSNPNLQTIFHFLTSEKANQARRRAKPKAGWPDGRHKFGTVSGAIKTVLAEADTEMRMKDIHVEVQRLLGGAVAFQSVADYLIKNSKGPRPLFEKPRYGHYRLLS